jgi:hypothetical protein
MVDNWDLIPGRSREFFSFHHHIQTSFGGPPSLLSNGYKGSWGEGGLSSQGLKLTTHLHQAPRLGTHWAIPHTSSWHGTCLVTRANLPLPLITHLFSMFLNIIKTDQENDCFRMLLAFFYRIKAAKWSVHTPQFMVHNFHTDIINKVHQFPKRLLSI